MPILMLSISSMLFGTYSEIGSIVSSYGYAAVFALMALESTGLPIPSEVILPLTGHLVFTGVFNPAYAFAVVLSSSMLGIAFDYYLAYYMGKDVLYRHLRFFHIRQESLYAFEMWFKHNGPFAVFIGRFIPEVRGLISLPAGFAMMPKKQFFIYSFTGALIWDTVLMAFGYYAFATSNISITATAIAAFAIVLYLLYTRFTMRIKHLRK